MKEQKFDVNKLRVATPCPANWNAMRGDNKIRFCDSCNLNVYNFSEMTSEEIKGLIAKAEGRICGKIYRRADGTLLTQDCPVGVRGYYKRTARFAGAALTAILGLFSVSFAQSKTDDSTQIVPASHVKIVRTPNQNQETILKGVIYDASGAVIPNAELTLIKDKQKFTARANDEGEYKITSLPVGIYKLQAQYPGFKVREITELEIKKNTNTVLNIRLDVGDLMGDIIIIETPKLTIQGKTNQL